MLQKKTIMKPLSNRTNTFTDSVIRRMTRVSLQYDAVNLSQGFPDFDPPRELTDRLAAVAGKGPHQYAITWGAQNFREELAKKQKHFSGLSYDPNSEICITCGSTEAMMATMMTIVNPGDKVAVFSPFYENYGADAILSGAEPIYIPLVPPDFHFDANKIEDAFKKGCKALILCNPSNPCGKVFTREELQTIADLAIKYDVYIVTDEVYEHIIYAPHKHVYMASLPGMKERTIVCNSLSKTYSITGWRLGYILASSEIIERARKVHDFLTVGAAAPLMEAAIAGLQMPDSYYQKLGEDYANKKKVFVGGLKNLGFDYTDPQGAYYVMVDISRWLKKGESDYDFCIRLAKDVGVGAVPGSSFFREDVNNLIRFHFAKKEETLQKAIDRLAKLTTM